jgi:hypothetical protein
MKGVKPLFVTLAAGALPATLVACGGSSSTSASPQATRPPARAASPAAAPARATTSASGPRAAPPSAGALQAEATAAATGDIPDNQVFLTFRDPSAGYSLKYPEGWAQSGGGDRLTFRDKNNVVRVVVARAPRPTVAAVRRQLAQLGVHVTGGPTRRTISGKPALEVVYETTSPPNPVTGKRVTLVVDRYYLWRAGKEAIVDLGTPQGVDNVDAYRLIIESFRWR